mgnify:CR=1 FL=1
MISDAKTRLRNNENHANTGRSKNAGINADEPCIMPEYLRAHSDRDIRLFRHSGPKINLEKCIGGLLNNQQSQIIRAQASMLSPTSIPECGYSVPVNHRAIPFVQVFTDGKAQENPGLCFLSTRNREDLSRKPGQPKAGREPRDLRVYFHKKASEGSVLLSQATWIDQSENLTWTCSPVWSFTSHT